MDRKVDHKFIASAVFTNPEIGTVGYTEEEPAKKYGDINVYKSRFRPMAHSFPNSEIYSLFKIIIDAKTDEVVGCHLATDGAGEMIQGVAIAVKMGATKADFDATSTPLWRKRWSQCDCRLTNTRMVSRSKKSRLSCFTSRASRASLLGSSVCSLSFYVCMMYYFLYSHSIYDGFLKNISTTAQFLKQCKSFVEHYPISKQCNYG
jgi:hypothetical protein